MGVNVFLFGGGTRLAAHVGAVKAITDSGQQITAWSGASAGSLVGAVYSAGWSHEQAFELMMETNYRRFLRIRPLRMMRDFGIYSGDAFEKWLDELLGGARFRSLDIPFSVVTTDITTGAPLVFSHDETPDAKIATAVRCSISIPGIFGVRRLGESVLTDGSLTTVTADQLFPDAGLPSLIVRMKRDPDSLFEHRSRFGLASFISRMMEILLRAADDYCRPETFTHDCCLHLGTNSPLTFGITPETKQELFDLGFEQTGKQLMAATFERLSQIYDEIFTNEECENDLLLTTG